jgi:hypothetical protein
MRIVFLVLFAAVAFIPDNGKYYLQVLTIFDSAVVGALIVLQVLQANASERLL